MPLDDAGPTLPLSNVCSDPMRAELISLSLDSVQNPSDLVFALRLLHTATSMPPGDIAIASGVALADIEALLRGRLVPLSHNDFLTVVGVLGVNDARPWELAWHRAMTQLSRRPRALDRHAENPPSPDQQFYSEYLQQTLAHANRSFNVAMTITTVAALLSIAAIMVALFSDNPGSSLAMAAISLFSTGAGSVVTRHANRTRASLTHQAERVDQAIRFDRSYVYATNLIAQVEDPVLRDELHSLATLCALGLPPSE
ncbi:hypothetical protein ACFWU5_10810 [Nocardia sp. NPDC058640]|uniref:TRADD-N-associated membrane domain-containing protein n=1 Tax=Nocardia sp. NPDC058640 TaxID=3346571 RepID=UPI00365D8709